MKNLIILFFILLSGVTFGQTYFMVRYSFEFSNLNNVEELNDISFYCIKNHTELELIYYKADNKFHFYYVTMGNTPTFIIEKNNSKMYINFHNYPVGNAKVEDIKFEEGYFYIEDLKLVRIEEELTIEWLNQQKTEDLKLLILENNEN